MPNSDIQRSNKGQKNNTPIIPTWMNYCMDCCYWSKRDNLPLARAICTNEKSEKRFKMTSDDDNCDHFREK